MVIIKRNRKKVSYNRDRIVNAIKKANSEVAEGYRITDIAIEAIVDEIELLLKGRESIPVEEIQDLVERSLNLNASYFLTRAYATYRDKRKLVRDVKSMDENILSLLRNENKDLAEENSNKNTAVASTQRDYIAGEVSKDITKRLLLPSHIWKAHERGVIHFHDSDYFVQQMNNCCLINIGDMLDNGTSMNGKMIETPKGFQVACTVMTQIIACVASNQYGGQSVDISHLGKYLRKTREKAYKRIELQTKSVKSTLSKKDYAEIIEKLVEEYTLYELKSGVQTIQYQINTLMTTNGQAPFVTLFLNLKSDDPYIKENAMIIEEILNQRLLGIKNEMGVYITPAFPKIVYVLDEHNCLAGGEYDYITRLAAKCSSKRMYPDYISAKKMREHYENNVFSPMGCRSFLSPWKDGDGNYKFEGRFNQGVVSINLPQIGLITGNDQEAFWKLLDERLELCFEALMCRHNELKKATSDVSPIHWQHGAIARLKKGESIEKLLFDGYSSISLGYIGLYELTMAVIGESHTTEKGKKFALEVLTYLRDTTQKWKEETNIGFGLYGTPAESLCYRFAKLDAEQFGMIKDITDKGYYTNSYHVDVREEINAFDKFIFESEFQPLSSGGCISYIEIPDMKHNPEALETLIKFIYDTIQYAEFNTKSDYCHKCDFSGEIKLNDTNYWECPQCGNKDKRTLTVTRRTCGYLGENFWNEGKTKEIKNRYIHL